jgi:hypothetical protein
MQIEHFRSAILVKRKIWLTVNNDEERIQSGNLLVSSK